MCLKIEKQKDAAIDFASLKNQSLLKSNTVVFKITIYSSTGQLQHNSVKL